MSHVCVGTYTDTCVLCGGSGSIRVPFYIQRYASHYFFLNKIRIGLELSFIFRIFVINKDKHYESKRKNG